VTTLHSGRFFDISPPPCDELRDKEIFPNTKEVEDVRLNRSDNDDTSRPEVIVKSPTSVLFCQLLVPPPKGASREDMLDVLK